MKIYEFFGLSRSGHHAMMNWFFKNMVGEEYTHEWQITVFGNKGWTHWNDSTVFKEKCLQQFKNLEKPNILSISYDNVPWEFSFVSENSTPFVTGYFQNWTYTEKIKIVFLRDFYNNLVSRIKMHDEMGEPRAFYDERYLSVWKNHVKACIDNKVLFIKYEDWLLDTNKRRDFLNRFNCRELYNNTQISGTISSFGESKNYLNRFDSNLIPEKIKKIIREDSELHYLMGRIGYEYKEL